MRLEHEEKQRLRDLFTTQLQNCEQVRCFFSTSQHLSFMNHYLWLVAAADAVMAHQAPFRPALLY
jgi:hypothetical protein